MSRRSQSGQASGEAGRSTDAASHRRRKGNRINALIRFHKMRRPGSLCRGGQDAAPGFPLR